MRINPTLVDVPGHVADPGKTYPGMGNPMEWYPKCSCGWRGTTVTEWEARGVFRPLVRKGELVLDAEGFIAPVSMDGEHRDAVAQIVAHLQVKGEELVNRERGWIADMARALKDAANDEDFQAAESAIMGIRQSQARLAELEFYTEVQKEGQPLVETYSSPANQQAMLEAYESGKRMGHYR